MFEYRETKTKRSKNMLTEDHQENVNFCLEDRGERPEHSPQIVAQLDSQSSDNLSGNPTVLCIARQENQPWESG